jgi:hypothetical protein
MPAPFWPSLPAANGAAVQPAFGRPELLRFASDSFMEQFMALLERDPARLAELRAQPESWRAPMRDLEPPPNDPPFARALARQRRIAQRRAALTAAPASTAPAQGRTLPLKLYQPAHQRFYLVSACLVCRMPGLPDRALDLPAHERASFVLRLLRPRSSDGDAPTIDPHDCDEYALTGTGHDATWQKIAGDARALIAGEEQHPLFGVTFQADDDRRRRLFAGVVPVGKREIYMGARERAAAADPPAQSEPRAELDPRDALLLTQVIEPWKQLIYRLEMRSKQIVEGPPAGMSTDGALDPAPQYKEARDQAQTVSWYILLDLAEYLHTYANDVWTEIIGTTSNLALTQALDAISLPVALRDALIGGGTPYTIDSIWSSLRAALAQIDGWRDELEKVSAAYDRRNPAAGWPNQLFPLADPQHGGPLWGDDDDRAAPVEDLRQQILAALVPLKDFTGVMPALPLVAQQALAPSGPAWFTIRCVFERPNCGPLAPTLVSDMSEPFQIAAFFDPDAPARPIRIAMPMDISPGGLRKFAKNTGFVISDMLQCQIEKLGGMSLGDLVRSVLPWPLHKDLPADSAACASGGVSFGMICSLSIPIITICALILLMIIVSLLDIIFRWIPFFILCLPLPGLKARPKPPT